MLNRVTAQHGLKDLLDLVKTDVMRSLNCHSIGTIQEFNSAEQTAKVSINYKKVVYDRADTPTLLDYPVLVDCPVIILSGGDGVITFPIKVGDTCLVLFNDRDIDNWFSSGQVMGPASPRLHSFADGIVLVGVRSLKTPVADYDAARVVIGKDTTKVKLGDKVRIENASSDLLTALTQLITTLDTFFTATSGASIEPTLAPAASAAKTAVAAFKTTLQGLLE
jgi:hypothetical protein